MRVNDLLKWKRSLNEIKYKHQELELIKEICDGHASEFQRYMEDYCAANDISLAELNTKKSIEDAKAAANAASETKKIENKKQTPGLVSTNNHFTEDAPPVEEMFVEERDNDEMHKAFKDLFKKLAMHLHPDRAEGLTAEEKDDRLSMFKDAKMALDNGDYFLLLDMSERFGIRMPKNYKQQTRWMKARIKQIDQEIRAQKHTYNYVFSECETESEKAKIVKNFLRQIFQI